MSRFPTAMRRRRRIRMIIIMCAMAASMMKLMILLYYFLILYKTMKRRSLRNSKEKSMTRMKYICSLIGESDRHCISELRMNRRTFDILCEMVTDIGGLKDTRNMSIKEIVAMFLYVLAHHKKNRTISHIFLRSGETVSRQFNRCLLVVLKLHQVLLKTPEPITDDCTDGRWNCFKNCLGALDGTLIRVTPPSLDKVRYRTRKASVATNVLGVCSPDMQFIYVLPGWEGLARDGRVLRDATSRPNGLRVPQGCYYLVDAGYCNAKGFLAPYRGQHYHLNEFHGRQPQSAEEYFNMKHSKARNVIERCFGLLKGKWKILASPSFFPINTQVRIIMACCLLHNLIRKNTNIEAGEDNDGDDIEASDNESDYEEDEVEYITSITK